MLSVKDIEVAYGESKVIHGVSFDAQPGETVAIMGRNGMGKTTLMKSLIGTLKSSAGSISIGGNPVEKLDSYMRVKN